MTGDLAELNALIDAALAKEPGKLEARPIRTGWGGDPNREPDYWDIDLASSPPNSAYSVTVGETSAAEMADHFVAFQPVRAKKFVQRLATAEAKIQRVEQLAQRLEDAFGHSGLAELIRRELRD